ncbi:ubiquinol-cytochrome C chaperone family protein [Sphingomonas sanguinis]|jgi:cytochrome b pre-mRNA-processing protein 3|uniref:Ubiquinol-cytochrome C chaperone n=1 Tax=Sphingomonas sanguinis TaxID=33051 RepID=A0A7Y7QUR5_9SPHN|nr:ubiquinol-cytochrome C chaperone family protein [Sphingomonas sanguinis]MBZ6381762.1 ubiquinol-cytochrome C chaperone [Sphingomonas sanguinis]NNG48366.1 ubiquinol-cytochrome C chaperone [Sphingomonas sanguinis]NNG53988.1 ubiquinol-cytochrome C chaperone [Sphingomonas sanguinis]NVP31062.1 ubiquinol-cytochrome C chaperone [Sphingomonas sanguinis]
MALGWLKQGIARYFGRDGNEALPLYNAVVLRAREPHWYLDGAVPDTVDGRFDMIAAVLSLVLIRLEAEDAGAGPAARITERFVTDMDGQLRELGIGDIVVGKHIGRMMAMLGGRLTAYREGLAGDDASFDAALVRNLYRGEAPDAPNAVSHVRGALRTLHERLADVSLARLTLGELP